MSDELDVRAKVIIEADETASANRIKGQIPGIENAIKGKPIKVPVEITESSSAKNIKGQIKNLESALKTKSLKIQIGVDIAASMRAIKAAIPEIQNAFKGNPVKIPFVFDPKGAAKAAQQATKAAQEAAAKATSSSKGGRNSTVGSDDYQMRILKKRMEGLKYAESKAGLPQKLDWAGFNDAFNTGDIKAARSEFRLLTLEFSNLNQMVRGGLDSQLKNLPARISSAANAATDLAKKFSSIKIQGGIIPDDAIARIETLKSKLREFANIKPGEGVLGTHAYLETFRELEGELLKIKEVYKDTAGTFRKEKIEIGADKLKVDIDNIQKNLLKMKSNWSAFLRNPELVARWDQLFDASKVNMTAAQVRKLGAEVQGLGRDIQIAGLDRKNIWEQLTNNFKKFWSWLAVGTTTATFIRGMREMVDNVKAVDIQMTELRKVTDETKATYDQFFSSASKRAVELATSLDKYIGSVADFARMGYSISDSQTLADTATIYYNVGDGLASMEEATSSVISTLKAYNLTADQSTRITDIFNEVSNKFAVTSGGIGSAMQRSGAALATANTSLEKSVALFTAMNEVIQNDESSATSLRFIAQRMRNTAGELEKMGEDSEGAAESVTKLQQQMLKLTGVNLMSDSENFRDVYDVLKDISGVWDDISDKDQADVVRLMAGNNYALAA